MDKELKRPVQAKDTNILKPDSFKGLPKSGNMTPEYITGKLFSYHNTAHFYHLQTNSHATHKALDHLYEQLVHMKDEIPEFLLGCQVPKRLEYIVLDEVKPYSETALLNFLEEGCTFASKLGEYAESNNWGALEDMAGKVEKLFNHCKLMITYM